jgi:hypothetical protein
MHLKDKPYRFIHDNDKVIQEPFYAGKSVTYVGAGKTGFQANTEQECWDEIDRLGLELPEDGEDSGHENETP